MNVPTDANMISMTDVMMNWKNPKLNNKESINDSFKLEHFYSGLFNILLSTWCESVALVGGGNNDKRHQNSSGLISSSILPTLEIVVKLMVVSQIDDCVDFGKLYGQVIKNFPYEALHQNMSDKKKITNLEDTTAKQLNLDICYLGFQMKNQNQEIILQLIDFIGGKLISSNNF